MLILSQSARPVWDDAHANPIKIRCGLFGRLRDNRTYTSTSPAGIRGSKNQRKNADHEFRKHPQSQSLSAINWGGLVVFGE
jgi:hypothetical protein